MPKKEEKVKTPSSRPDDAQETPSKRQEDTAQLEAMSPSPVPSFVRPMVFVNVYNVTEINNYIFFTGYRAYHTGVVIGNEEWAYGGGVYLKTGIFKTQPGHLPNSNGPGPSYKFYKTLEIGESLYNAKGVKKKANYPKASATLCVCVCVC